MTNRTKKTTYPPQERPLVSDASLGKFLKSVYNIGFPGFGQYLDGQLREGLMHTIAGVAAGAAFGPVGFWLVGANSVSRTASGKNLWEHAQASAADREDSEAGA